MKTRVLRVRKYPSLCTCKVYENMLACGFSRVSKDTFGWYPVAAIKGDGGIFGEPIVTIDEDGFAELYGEDGVAMLGVADIGRADTEGEGVGVATIGGESSGEVDGPWLGVFGLEVCFIAERRGGGRGT